MRKVYIFRNCDLEELEKNINDFIKDKELIDIKVDSVTAAPDMLMGPRIWITAMIIYEEKKTEPTIEERLLEIIHDMDDELLRKALGFMTNKLQERHPIEYEYYKPGEPINLL